MMRSTHRITLAVALAVSAVAGTAAATQTIHLGADAKEAPPISAKVLAAQKAKLAAADRSIESALAARPPALPKVPEFEPLGEPRVPPLVVTRVVPVASSASTSSGGDDSPGRSVASHPAPASDPAPAARTAPAPSPPVHADRDDDDDHRGSGGDDEDHDEDRDEDRGDERDDESSDDHDDD